MIPLGLTPAQFSARYRGLLEQKTKSAVDAIREVIGFHLPDEVLSAEVEVFLDDSGYGSPTIGIYFAGKNARVSKSDMSIFPGRSLRFEIDLKALSKFDEEYFTSDFDGLGLAANVLRQWFAECWWKAGGWTYRIPVVLAVHDGWGNGELVSLTESDA